MLVKRGPFYDIGLEGVVNFGYQLECQGLWRSVKARRMTQICESYLEDSCGWYAVGEQVIEFSSDLQDTSRSTFGENLVGHLRDECFPIRWWNGRLFRYWVTVAGQRRYNKWQLFNGGYILLCMDSLKHE